MTLREWFRACSDLIYAEAERIQLQADTRELGLYYPPMLHWPEEPVYKLTGDWYHQRRRYAFRIRWFPPRGALPTNRPREGDLLPHWWPSPERILETVSPILQGRGQPEVIL